MLFLAPALIALPPRKLDLYTVLLGASFAASANHLTTERTGRGLLGNMPWRGAGGGRQILANADEFAERYRAEKEERRRRRLLEEPISSGAADMGRAPSVLEARTKEIWMGGEQEGWKERRLREEQEKINQGEGYGSMIMDQIWEVWNWGEKKGEEIKAKDKEVLYRRLQEEKAKRREEENEPSDNGQ